MPPRFDEKDRFPEILAHFTGPEVAGLAVEADLPGLAKAEGKDLGQRSGRMDEWVIGRDGVGLDRVGSVDIDTEDGREQIAGELTGPHRIALSKTVAGRDVEVAVGAELERAAVVAIGREFKHDQLGIRVGLEQVAGQDFIARDTGANRPSGIAPKCIRRSIHCSGNRDERPGRRFGGIACGRFWVRRPQAEIEKEILLADAGPVFEREDAPAEIGDEKTGSSRRAGEQRGPVKDQARERAAGCVGRREVRASR